MIKYAYLLILFTALIAAACSSDTSADYSAAPEATETETVFGAPFTPAAYLTADELLPLITDEESELMQVSAEVTEVCQTKGCWLVMQTSDGQPIRVTFKDYAYFVPKDLAGQRVLMEGVSWKEITSVAHQQHYLEDAHASEEEIAAITEPKTGYYFEATGVVIL